MQRLQNPMSEIFSPNQVQEELRSYLVDTCQHTSLGPDLRSGQNHNAQAFQMGQDRAALYTSFSSWFAVRALINRVTSFRSVCQTTSNLPRLEKPIIIKRSSSSECFGSKTVSPKSSANAVEASSKPTRCLTKFVVALIGSHSNLKVYRNSDKGALVSFD